MSQLACSTVRATLISYIHQQLVLRLRGGAKKRKKKVGHYWAQGDRRATASIVGRRLQTSQNFDVLRDASPILLTLAGKT